MAFQGFRNSPGPARPPKNDIRFGVLTDSPSASKTSSLRPPLSSILSPSPPPPPPPPQRSAFSFGVGATLPSASPPIFFSYISKDMPPKEEKQQTEMMEERTD